MVSRETYGLEAEFERAVAKLCATDRRFWGLVGRSVEPELLHDRAARRCVAACGQLVSEGRQPTPLVVVQRVRRWHESGELTRDDLAACRELMAETTDDEHDQAAVDAIAAELAPVLRREAQRDALDQGLTAFAKDGDLSRVEALLASAKRIGCAETSVGIRLTADVVDRVAERSGAVRLSTGIAELDAVTGGGLRRGALGFVLGATNAGKSMFLDHVAAEAISNCVCTALATLELSSEDHHARVIGNLVDLPFSDIVQYPDVREEARERLAALEQDGLLAFLTVKEFTSRATSVADLAEWLDAEEGYYREKVELLLVDYPSLLCDPARKVRHEEASAVVEQLRALAVDRDVWIWGAHQANAEGMNARKTKRLDNWHVAESKGVAKTADLIVTINPRDDGESILWFVSKNRHGPHGDDAGPLPVDFERGRVAPCERSGWPF